MLARIASEGAYLELAAGLQGTDHCASLLPRCADYRDQFSIVRYHGSSPCAKVIQLGFPPLTHSATTGVPFGAAPLSRRCAVRRLEAKPDSCAPSSNRGRVRTDGVRPSRARTRCPPPLGNRSPDSMSRRPPARPPPQVQER